MRGSVTDYADVMELVVFLSSDGRAERRAGSNPVIRTNQNLRVPQQAIRAEMSSSSLLFVDHVL